MIAGIQFLVLLALHVAVFVLCAFALIDAARRPANAFTSAGKRTKGFWVALLGVATAIAFIAIPYPPGSGRLGFFVAGLAAAAAGVYLADVRPAVGPYSGGKGPRGPRRPGGPGGGW